MPFELGLFLGAKEFGDRRQKQKDLLVLEKNKGDCALCCSDLGGTDPVAHNGRPSQAVEHVRNWLNRFSLDGVSGPTAISSDYKSFKDDLPAVLASLRVRVKEATFVDFRGAAAVWLDRRRSGANDPSR